MFAEDLTPFFDTATGFAVAGTLQGVAVTVILDAATRDEFGGELLTVAPSVLLTRAAAASAAVGQTLVIASTTYTVRAVRDESPDGALRRLDLVRA